MVEITSRKDLEIWLEGKPVEFAQVIAARAALRALPYSLLRKELIDVKINHANIVFRDAIGVVTKLINIVHNEEAHQSVAGKFLVNAAHELHDLPVGTTFRPEVAALTSLRAVNAAIQLPAAVVRDYTAMVYSACVAFDDQTDAWRAVSADAEWLNNRATRSATHRFDTSELWHGEQPSNLALMMSSIQNRLLAFDPTYQVWIDWYSRRIEGHDASFDIPGDTDRNHDKAILARLADASDEDFWGKGATYVNTTLQSWIDEARIEARIEEIIRILRGGATAYYGSPEDLAGRAALLTELDRLLGRSRKARDGIGGNYPPDPIDLSVQPVALPEEMREPLEAISTELEKREPDPLKIVEQSKMLHRIGRKLEKMASLAGEEFAKNVGAELGKRVVQGAFWLTLINQILDWLTPLIRIAG